jgi:predicted phosphodiesterase
VRLAVISDIHANLYALEAVLEEIDRDPPDEIWCLGDTVGYGPRPNECYADARREP